MTGMSPESGNGPCALLPDQFATKMTVTASAKAWIHGATGDRAGGERTVQHPGQTDIPRQLWLIQDKTEVDGSGRQNGNHGPARSE